MSKDYNDKIDYIQDRLDVVADTCSNIDKELALQKAAFEDHLKQDERMYEEFKRMNDILQHNTESLKEHMRRSDLLEDIVSRMDNRINPIEMDYVKKVAVNDWINAKLKFLGKVGAAMTVLTGAWVFLKPLLINYLKL